MDQGSPGFAGWWYLAYSLKARVVLLHDPFHRQWNDAKGAIKEAGLWWVVLLSTICHNLAYGPWEGAAWFEKIKAGADEYLQQERIGNPLFEALYAKVCADIREPALGTVAHKEKILRELRSSEAFSKKGPMTTLKRWFSWVASSRYHDRTWHSRLLIILAIGLMTGSYKSYLECPLWGGPLPAGKAADNEEEAEKTKEQEKAAEVAALDKAPAPEPPGAASGSGDGSHLMRAEEESLKALRAKSRNSLFLAASILSKDGLQEVCRAITVLTGPLFTEHSSLARDLKGPTASVAYYLEAAQGSWQKPLRELAGFLQDSTVLSFLGFDTTFASLPKALEVASTR
eukprot:14565143-Alexandrium_andersonii.AAC.1